MAILMSSIITTIQRIHVVVGSPEIMIESLQYPLIKFIGPTITLIREVFRIQNLRSIPLLKTLCTVGCNIIKTSWKVGVNKHNGV